MHKFISNPQVYFHLRKMLMEIIGNLFNKDLNKYVLYNTLLLHYYYFMQ